MACSRTNTPATATTLWGMEYTLCREWRRPSRAAACVAAAAATAARSPCNRRVAAPHDPPPPPAAPAAAPKRVLDQLKGIFGAEIANATDLLVVPTCQHAELDLVATGAAPPSGPAAHGGRMALHGGV